MKLLVLILGLAAVTSALPAVDSGNMLKETMDEMWTLYKNKYNKEYSQSDDVIR